MLRAAACLIALLAAAQGVEVAVWEGGDADTERLGLRRRHWDAVAAWLGEAGLAVVRADGRRMQTAGGLDPVRIPVLVMSAHHVPLVPDAAARAAGLHAYLAYLDAGGIIVGLGTAEGGAALGVAIAPQPGGTWDLSPTTPRFAWEVADLREALGLRYAYDPARHDRGVRFVPTALLHRYWPEAPVVTTRLRQVQHLGIAAAAPAFHALYDGQDADGGPAMPAVFVARAGGRTAILGNNPGWWSPDAVPWFGGGRQLTVALVRLALDLHAGTATLPAEDRRELAPQPASSPMDHRLVVGEVDPDSAEPVVRWGRFDGSGRELAAAATAPHRGEPADRLPGRLDPGASVRLAVPAHAGAAWLRVRCAHTASDAGLLASLDGRAVISERLIYLPPGGGAGDPARDPPAEITRCAFVSPGGAGVLELANPGTAPLWFDAVQLERRPRGGGAVCIGWHATASAPGADCSGVGLVACPAHLELIGAPGDTRRWDALDRLYDGLPAGVPLQAVLAGTPRWMARADSLAEAERSGHPEAAVPDPRRYREGLRDWLARYGGRFTGFQLMQEVDQRTVWSGSFGEWAMLADAGLALIREARPQALVLAGGCVGQPPALFDALAADGLGSHIDGLAIHAFAGQSEAWELPAGAAEGECLARGLAVPQWAAQQGFPWRDAPPTFTGGWTPERQARSTDIALARLVAAGRSRVLVFTSTAPGHAFACRAADGTPNAVGIVLADYQRLNLPGATRVDPQMLAADGGPLRGTYIAASQGGDGTIIAVVNPCQAGGGVRVRLLVPLPDARPRRAALAIAGVETAVALREVAADGVRWAELELELGARGVLRLAPAAR